MTSPETILPQSAVPSVPPVWRLQEDPFAKQPSPATIRGINWLAEYPDFEAQPRPDPKVIRDQLLQLRKFYTVLSQDSLIIATLAEFPALFLLLKDAAGPLRRAFGERLLLQLEALQSDEGTILRVVVRLPFGTDRPAELMRNFKRAWWLDNCSRSEASLVFDYETGNGF